jgi:hypothetical protein
MLLSKRIWTLLLALVTTVALCAPTFGMDFKKTLKKMSPHKHPYIYTTIGGAAVGGGIGALVGGGGNFAKGLLLGGGGASAFYLHFHHEAGGDYRPWAYFATHTALGTGAGWTICGCGTGAVTGLLVGAGADLLWQTMKKPKKHPTASTNP